MSLPMDKSVEDIVTDVLKSRYPVDTVPQDAVHFSEREQGHHFHDKNPAVGTESIYINREQDSKVRILG